MSKKEIIESGILERYILGTTSTEENSFVQQKCKEFPELNQELDSIELALLHYAELESPLNTIRKESIKQNILMEVSSSSKNISSDAKIIPLSNLSYRIGIAASIVLLITSVVYNIATRNDLNNTKNELAKMKAQEVEMNDVVLAQKNEMELVKQKMAMITDPSTKAVVLNGMNSMVNKKAMVYFNQTSKEVYFNARDLQLSDPEKQYQLWAIVDGKPVDMGMIDLNAKDIFQKMKAIENAQAFAVTIEKKGGNPTPTMETMCLMGNV